MRRHENFWEPKKNGERELQKDIQDGIDEAKNGIRVPEVLASGDLRATTDMPRILGDDGIDQLYGWYESAMRRRDREPLEKGRFVGHFFENNSLDPTFAFGDRDRGYVLGVVRGGIFVPTHFAPKTIYSAYALLKELGAHPQIPCVMAITEDLAQTIAKMPQWQVLPIAIPRPFGEETVSKKIAYNQHPDTPRLMGEALREHFRDMPDTDIGSLFLQ